jgi:hypothetical protein
MATQARKTIKPAPKPLTLADVDIVWSGPPTAGVSLIPVLRFGGSQAISIHLRGLCDLLGEHEVLDEHALVFVRESLNELARRLYVAEYDGEYEDAGAAANCKIVPRAPQAGKKEEAA